MKFPAQLKPALWGAVVGAILMMIGGFTVMGWKTGHAATEMARLRSSEAVVAAMVPFCVAKAKQDPNTETMGKFRAENSSYARVQIVTTAGWATLGGAASSDYGIATACAERLQAALN